MCFVREHLTNLLDLWGCIGGACQELWTHFWCQWLATACTIVCGRVSDVLSQTIWVVKQQLAISLNSILTGLWCGDCWLCYHCNFVCKFWPCQNIFVQPKKHVLLRFICIVPNAPTQTSVTTVYGARYRTWSLLLARLLIRSLSIADIEWENLSSFKFNVLWGWAQILYADVVVGGAAVSKRMCIKCHWLYVAYALTTPALFLVPVLALLSNTNPLSVALSSAAGRHEDLSNGSVSLFPIVSSVFFLFLFGRLYACARGCWMSVVTHFRPWKYNQKFLDTGNHTHTDTLGALALTHHYCWLNKTKQKEANSHSIMYADSGKTNVNPKVYAIPYAQHGIFHVRIRRNFPIHRPIYQPSILAHNNKPSSPTAIRLQRDYAEYTIKEDHTSVGCCSSSGIGNCSIQSLYVIKKKIIQNALQIRVFHHNRWIVRHIRYATWTNDSNELKTIHCFANFGLFSFRLLFFVCSTTTKTNERGQGDVIYNTTEEVALFVIRKNWKKKSWRMTETSKNRVCVVISFLPWMFNSFTFSFIHDSIVCDNAWWIETQLTRLFALHTPTSNHFHVVVFLFILMVRSFISIGVDE